MEWAPASETRVSWNGQAGTVKGVMMVDGIADILVLFDNSDTPVWIASAMIKPFIRNQNADAQGNGA